MLEQHGLVETRPGRLTRVTETTFEDVARVYAPLGALEALAAELATPKATSDTVDELRLHNAELLAAANADDPSAAREADRAFHGVLLQLADNPYLTAAIEPILVHHPYESFDSVAEFLETAARCPHVLSPKT